MVIASSISGLPIYAPSAAFAPTNSANVSAIASAYQVVSSTATQLYAGTAYVTSVNDAPLSAARAGNAANASLANSAYYDGTGRLISALPDSAAVSSIASSYAESAASSKLDSSASSSFYPADNPSGFISSIDLSDYATTAYVDSSISGFAYNSAVSGWTAKQDTLTYGYNAANQISSIDGSALGGMDEAAVSGIASAYAESAVSAASSNYYPATSNPSGYLTAQAQASWSESASASPSYIQDKPDLVDIVAGPGIHIDNPDGNTLRVSMAADYEVTLFENASGTTTNIVCSEKMSNFDRVRFYLYPSENTINSEYTTEFAGSSTIFRFARLQYNDGGNFPFVIYGTYYSTTDSKTITIGATEHIWFGPSWGVGGTGSTSPIKFVKIVGINRIAND